jgi:hypothetical protein
MDRNIETQTRDRYERARKRKGLAAIGAIVVACSAVSFMGGVVLGSSNSYGPTGPEHSTELDIIIEKDNQYISDKARDAAVGILDTLMARGDVDIDEYGALDLKRQTIDSTGEYNTTFSIIVEDPAEGPRTLIIRSDSSRNYTPNGVPEDPNAHREYARIALALRDERKAPGSLESLRADVAEGSPKLIEVFLSKERPHPQGGQYPDLQEESSVKSVRIGDGRPDVLVATGGDDRTNMAVAWDTIGEAGDRLRAALGTVLVGR